MYFYLILTPPKPATEEFLLGNLYEFKHQGHCAAGWDGGPNTNQESILDCRNDCATRSGVGYFAYKRGSNCECYFSNGGCPDDNYYNDHKAYRILKGIVLYQNMYK